LVEIDTSAFLGLIGLMVPIVVIGGFIWRGFVWMNRKQDEKSRERLSIDEKIAERKKQEEEQKAEDLRKYTDRIATDLKENTNRIALGLKEATEKLADDLKFNTASMAKELKQVTENVAFDLKAHTKNINEEMLRTVKDTNEKFVQRADLTNGNVSNIRKDILELSGDVEELYNDIHTGEDGGMSENVRKRRFDKKRNRRRDQIDIDRVSQERSSADREGV
jgi:hypothetical protein